MTLFGSQLKSGCMKVAVFHPGTQHSWQTAIALQQLGVLEWYATSIFYQPEKWPYKIERFFPGRIRAAINREFNRFYHPEIDQSRLITLGSSEWFERLARRVRLFKLAKRIDQFGNIAFSDALSSEMMSDRRFSVWGYNSSAEKLFINAKNNGRTCILDRTIGDWRAYNQEMSRIQEQYRDWFLETERCQSAEVIAGDQREYDLADVIVVGSEYAAETVRLHGGQGIADKVKVLPYCFDDSLFGHTPDFKEQNHSDPVRFLFVGQVNPRKGIHHLLEAISEIPSTAAKLTIVGELRVPKEIFSRYADRVEYIPTVPRYEMPAIMARHDVLVFPSYFEGSALSLLESLASGLGIIQTRAAGNGADGTTGIVLEYPSTASLRDAMMFVIENRNVIDTWREASLKRAQKFSFKNYKNGIGELLSAL